MDFWLGLGILFAGYFIGDGIKHMGNPETTTSSSIFSDGNNLIKEKDIHYYINISKEDVKTLIEEHPDIPHIEINGNKYFHKHELQKWIKEEMKRNKE